MSNDEKPGVSPMYVPPPSAYSSMWRVVCRPRPSFSDTSATGTASPGASRFRMLDLPTPEFPVNTANFPEMASRRASMPSPVSALVTNTG